MVRRVAAIGLLVMPLLVFAMRFSPPPTDRFDLDKYLAGIHIESQPQPKEATRPTFTPLPTVTTTTLALPPGVSEYDSEIIRFERGLLQLRVQITLDELTDIEMIRTPHSSKRAKQINQDTHPILRAEAIELQDYRVHVVSGATETTYAWARALRDTLEQAEFCIGPRCNIPVR